MPSLRERQREFGDELWEIGLLPWGHSKVEALALRGPSVNCHESKIHDGIDKFPQQIVRIPASPISCCACLNSNETGGQAEDGRGAKRRKHCYHRHASGKLQLGSSKCFPRLVKINKFARVGKHPRKSILDLVKELSE